MDIGLNILSYGIYFSILSAVIIRVGQQCHDNGSVWMLEYFSDKAFITTVNRLLLLAYYLLNIGYAAYLISSWPQIESTAHALEQLAERTAHIILILATLHYFNILAIMLYARSLTPNNTLRQAQGDSINNLKT